MVTKTSLTWGEDVIWRSGALIARVSVLYVSIMKQSMSPLKQRSSRRLVTPSKHQGGSPLSNCHLPKCQRACCPASVPGGSIGQTHYILSHPTIPSFRILVQQITIQSQCTRGLAPTNIPTYIPTNKQTNPIFIIILAPLKKSYLILMQNKHYFTDKFLILKSKSVSKKFLY